MGKVYCNIRIYLFSKSFFVCRSCRELIKQHDSIESELALCASRINELQGQSQNLHEEGHFDSKAISRNVGAIQNALHDLHSPAKERRAILEESLEFHKFSFTIDAELQWIKEHLPVVSSDDLGQNLHQAQNLYKKNKKLQAEIVGHQPVIDKTLEAGQTLIEENHPENKQVFKLFCYPSYIY